MKTINSVALATVKAPCLNIAETKIQNALVNSDDRSAVLVGAALLEQKLEDLLATRMISSTAAKKLLGSGGHKGPLGYFYGKILGAWTLGLISDDEYTDLEIIRGIRNIFAHDVLECDFKNPEIQSECSKLRVAWKALGTKSAPRRIAFNVEIYTLVAILSDRITKAEARPKPPARRLINGK